MMSTSTSTSTSTSSSSTSRSNGESSYFGQFFNTLINDINNPTISDGINFIAGVDRALGETGATATEGLATLPGVALEGNQGGAGAAFKELGACFGTNASRWLREAEFAFSLIAESTHH
jgi:hypothetical protein